MMPKHKPFKRMMDQPIPTYCTCFQTPTQIIKETYRNHIPFEQKNKANACAVRVSRAPAKPANEVRKNLCCVVHMLQHMKPVIARQATAGEGKCWFKKRPKRSTVDTKSRNATKNVIEVTFNWSTVCESTPSWAFLCCQKKFLSETYTVYLKTSHNLKHLGVWHQKFFKLLSELALQTLFTW